MFKSAGVGTAPVWGAIGGSTASTAAAAFGAFAAPAAAGVDVHAAIASDNAAPVTTGLTSPAIPRTLQVVFAALWDGGDVTIVGTDQFDAAVTETIADVAGTTVQGVKVFKTVTSIATETVGAGGALTATVQTGEKLGLPRSPRPRRARDGGRREHHRGAQHHLRVGALRLRARRRQELRGRLREHARPLGHRPDLTLLESPGGALCPGPPAFATHSPSASTAAQRVAAGGMPRHIRKAWPFGCWTIRVFSASYG